MIKIIDAKQMREIDRLTFERYQTPTLLLMETAAASALLEIEKRSSVPFERSGVLILCGPGNNGGDGAALARQIALRGVARVDVVLCGATVERTKGDARINFEIIRTLAESAPDFTALVFHQFPERDDEKSLLAFLDSRGAAADILVDALFGTGLTRPVEGVYRAAIDYLNERRRSRSEGSTSPLIASLDLPSGLNADSTRLIGPAVEADLTVTFTAPKRANALPPASDFNGSLRVARLGSPQTLIDEADSRLFSLEAADAIGWLKETRYTADSYKNSHGHALIVAGSRSYAGAAALTANAAMRAGAGLVTLAAPASAIPLVVQRLTPEIITLPLPETKAGAVAFKALDAARRFASEKATVMAVGPGMSSEEASTRRFVRELVAARECPAVIDADGLNALSPWPANLRGRVDAPLILTPHLGEMRRLLGRSAEKTLEDREEAVRDFAAERQLILLLKGQRIMIGAPDGNVYVNPTGNPGSGTAGAGDTLTGLTTGFLAQAWARLRENKSRDATAAVRAVCAAAYVSGVACDLAADSKGMRSMIASDLRDHFGHAILALDPHGERPHGK